MATRLKVASSAARAIRHAGSVARSVEPEVIAKALGAEIVPRDRVRGGPIALHALRRELERRVRSTGGRPALEGARKIQKIPLNPEDWSRLEKLAGEFSRQGISATAGQVASVILHRQLEGLAVVGVRDVRIARRAAAPSDRRFGRTVFDR